MKCKVIYDTHICKAISFNTQSASTSISLPFREIVAVSAVSVKLRSIVVFVMGGVKLRSM